MFVLQLLCLISSVLGDYVPVSKNSGATFFDDFTFTFYSNGFAIYVNKSVAEQKGLITTSPTVRLSVDSSGISSDKGRDSVSIATKTSYTNGLFILDATHTPVACGGWPAFWTVGTGHWPDVGEIDILESLDTSTFIQATTHQKAGACPDNHEVTIKNSFGRPFNMQGGGVFAMEWKPILGEGIRVWAWNRSSIPSDITSGEPDPSNWKQPGAFFPFDESCPPSAFTPQHVLLNIELCGFAESYWGDYCLEATGMNSAECPKFVQQNPKNFTDAYWEVNYLNIYQDPAVNSSNGAKRLGTMKPLDEATLRNRGRNYIKAMRSSQAESQ